MTLLRVLILSIVLALGTVLLAWWIVPMIGVGYGVVMHRARRPGLEAAVAGAVAWGGYLGALSIGGAPVGAFGGKLAGAMGLPGAVPYIATLLFPALLAGLAATAAAGTYAKFAAKPELARSRR